MPTILPKLGLYIHFPWCAKKCPYCDFNSHTLKEQLPEQDYIQALLTDLTQDLPYVKGRELNTIFMGGGTPSLFSPASLQQLLAEIGQRINFASDIEITLEANPGSVEQTKFQAYFTAGINRLSLGIQSLQDDKLAALGRIHNAHSAYNAVVAAKQAGFINFNIDLMFGLPAQSLDDALHDLSAALSLAPTHLSWYQLTLEPNTLFYHRPPPLPADDMLWEFQQQGQHLLKSHGYEQYEVSAYAKSGKQCRHNRNYWEFGDYLGIGAGAHSKLTLSDGQVMRMSKLKHPKAYLMNPSPAEQKFVAKQDLGFEFMLNYLRLKQAFTWQLFEQQTLLDRNSLAAPLQLAELKGLVTINPQGFTVTDLGWQFLNDLLELFLPKQ
jgi:putative oxygen-independent coproporphyrinogen III oxidase